MRQCQDINWLDSSDTIWKVTLVRSSSLWSHLSKWLCGQMPEDLLYNQVCCKFIKQQHFIFCWSWFWCGCQNNMLNEHTPGTHVFPSLKQLELILTKEDWYSVTVTHIVLGIRFEGHVFKAQPRPVKCVAENAPTSVPVEQAVCGLQRSGQYFQEHSKDN